MKIGYQIPADATAASWAIDLLCAQLRLDGQNEYLVYLDMFARTEAAAGGADLHARLAPALGPKCSLHPVAAENLAQYLYQTNLDDLEKQLGNPDLLHVNEPFCPMLLRRATPVVTVADLRFLDEPGTVEESARVAAMTSLFNAAAFDGHFLCLSDDLRRRLRQAFPHLPARRVAVIDPGNMEASAHTVLELYARLAPEEWKGRP